MWVQPGRQGGPQSQISQRQKPGGRMEGGRGKCHDSVGGWGGRCRMLILIGQRRIWAKMRFAAHSCLLLLPLAFTSGQTRKPGRKSPEDIVTNWPEERRRPEMPGADSIGTELQALPQALPSLYSFPFAHLYNGMRKGLSLFLRGNQSRPGSKGGQTSLPRSSFMAQKGTLSIDEDRRRMGQRAGESLLWPLPA